MAADRFTFSEQDCQRIKAMLLAFERGEMNARPRYRRKEMPWRYPSSSAYFYKISSNSSTPIAGRAEGSEPYVVAQDTAGVNYGLDSDSKLDNLDTGVDPYNYSRLPQPDARFVPVLTGSDGTPFLLPLWSCFGIQMICVYAYNTSGITTSANNVNFTSWTGPNAADAYDSKLWYDRLTTGVELKKIGDYFCMAYARFKCDAGSAEPIQGVMSINSQANGGGITTWRSETSYQTESSAMCFTTIEKPDASSVTVNVNVTAASLVGLSSRTVTITACTLMIMPCGFGETS